MADAKNEQPEFPQSPENEEAFRKAIAGTVAATLAGAKQPSAAELLATVEANHGWFTRHVFAGKIHEMTERLLPERAPKREKKKPQPPDLFGG